jgi:hypothetical protein
VYHQKIKDRGFHRGDIQYALIDIEKCLNQTPELLRVLLKLNTKEQKVAMATNN